MAMYCFSQSFVEEYEKSHTIFNVMSFSNGSFYGGAILKMVDSIQLIKHKNSRQNIPKIQTDCRLNTKLYEQRLNAQTGGFS